MADNLDAARALRRLAQQGMNIEHYTIGKASSDAGFNRLIEDSVRRVTSFYHSQGVTVGNPLVKLVEEGAGLPAMRLNVEEQIAERYRKELPRQIRGRFRHLGYQLADDTVEEIATAQAERAAALLGSPAPAHPTADIVIYPSFIEQLKANPPELAPLITDHYLAHTTWHYIEEAHGVLDSSPLSEGTASYAQYLYWRDWETRTGQEVPPLRIKTSPIQQLFATSLDGLMRTASIEAIAEARPTLPALLNPAQRAHIEERRKELSETLVDQYCAALSTNEQLAYLDGRLEKELFPELAEILKEGGCNQPALIKAWRAAGLNKLADELEHRDILAVLSHYASRWMGHWKNPS